MHMRSSYVECNKVLQPSLRCLFVSVISCCLERDLKQLLSHHELPPQGSWMLDARQSSGPGSP